VFLIIGLVLLIAIGAFAFVAAGCASSDGNGRWTLAFSAVCVGAFWLAWIFLDVAFRLGDFYGAGL
jgi:hypothetical protein